MIPLATHLATHLAAWLLGAAIAASAAWQLQDWRLGAQIAGLKTSHAAQLAQAQETALATERDNATRYQGALNAARTREAALQRDVDRARAQSDGLREQAADAARRIADSARTAPAAVAEYATASAELLADCSRRYQAMAAAADGHAADARTLRDAWPAAAVRTE